MAETEEGVRTEWEDGEMVEEAVEKEDDEEEEGRV